MTLASVSNIIQCNDTVSCIAKFCDDIDNDRIQLPTLPEVALRVRDAVESENSNAKQISDIISNDAALSARLLQVANSPVYRGVNEIDSIPMAVTRLGVKLVKSLVISLAMKQIFLATSESLDHLLREAWDDAVQVAAISRVLATQVPNLEPDQAMLGGLIHNIGILPILTKLDSENEMEVDFDTVDHLMIQIVPEIGSHLLKKWRFTSNLANIPSECVNLIRDEPTPADYADIVLVARVQHLSLSGRLNVDWANIPAFTRIGLDTQVESIEALAPPAEEISEVREIFAA